MTEDEIERVAKALYEANCVLDGRKLNWGRGGYKTEVAYWHSLARAAAAAIRRPTP